MRANYPEDQVQQTLSTVARIFRNIIAHPQEQKYRSLNVCGRVYQNYIAKCREAVELLSVAGFNQSSDAVIFTRNDLGLLWALS